jgi:hypothetical protein
MSRQARNSSSMFQCARRPLWAGRPRWLVGAALVRVGDRGPIGSAHVGPTGPFCRLPQVRVIVKIHHDTLLRIEVSTRRCDRRDRNRDADAGASATSLSSSRVLLPLSSSDRVAVAPRQKPRFTFAFCHDGVAPAPLNDGRNYEWLPTTRESERMGQRRRATTTQQ